MGLAPPPRLSVIPAAGADVALIVWRGSKKWRHLAKWDLATGAVEHGAWFRHSFDPERCDLSPDGRWIVYLGAQYRIRYKSVSQTAFSREEWPQAFTAVSRAPWVYALAAWAEIGTYTRGCHFREKLGTEILSNPFVGAEDLHQLPYGLDWNDGERFGAERRRGWGRESSNTACISKACPTLPGLILVASFEPIRGGGLRYTLRHPDGAATTPLERAWADWTRDGRLMSTTHAGTLVLETLDPFGRCIFRQEIRDLVDLKPDPQPAPDWARRWT